MDHLRSGILNLSGIGKSDAEVVTPGSFIFQNATRIKHGGATSHISSTPFPGGVFPDKGSFSI